MFKSISIVLGLSILAITMAGYAAQQPPRPSTPPDFLNTTYYVDIDSVNSHVPVVMRDGVAVLDSANPMEPVEERCCDSSGLSFFVNPHTGTDVSKGRGLTEFERFYVWEKGPRLSFTDATGRYNTIVEIINDPGGSGTFTMIGVALGSRVGSNLISLGDRVTLTKFSYHDGIITVSYFLRKKNLNQKHLILISRSFQLSGDELVAI